VAEQNDFLKPLIREGLFFNTLYHLDVVESTNEWLKQRVRKGKLSSGTVVSASHQTSGRGQIGTSWQDKPGQNLLMTAFWRPIQFQIDIQYLLNMSICLALADVCLKYIKTDIHIKWPNDIYFKDQKLVGILIENSLAKKWEACFIGLGVNVNQLDFPSDFRATSLKKLTDLEVDVLQLRLEVVEALEIHLLRLAKGETKQILQDYYQRLLGMGEWRLFEKKGQLFEGRIEGVSKEGLLLVQTREGHILKSGVKEISFIWDH
jgi:BirA family biotin operon repressor/biotin-[acetyl-CoA-carboxylase] ligase